MCHTHTYYYALVLFKLINLFGTLILLFNFFKNNIIFYHIYIYIYISNYSSTVNFLSSAAVKIFFTNLFLFIMQINIKLNNKHLKKLFFIPKTNLINFLKILQPCHKNVKLKNSKQTKIL